MKDSLITIINACKKGKKESQVQLYRDYYNYAISITLRYSKTRPEAEEIANDGFVKVFQNLGKYDPKYPFQSWLRRIMINSSIDYFRKHKKHYNQLDITYAKTSSVSPAAISRLSEEEILNCVKTLSPAYRMVFNLFVVEGFSHKDIAEQLGVSIGTSKSNLAKARSKLKQLLKHNYQLDSQNYG